MAAEHGFDLSSHELDSFKLMADTRRQLETVSEQATQALRQCYRSPEELKAFIEAQGTPFYLTGNGFWANLTCKLTLKLMGFEPGFIPPGESERYRRLVAWLTRHEDHSPIYFDASRFEQGVFVITPDLMSISFLTHQIHHWLACQSGLTGYSDTSRKLYRAFWEKYQGQVTHRLLNHLSVEEILSLKSAINRDLEALAFLRRMRDEILIPNQLARHLKQG